MGSKTGFDPYIEEVESVSAVKRDLSLGDRIEVSEFGSVNSK